MEPAPRRSRFRLHPVTWLALVLVAAALGYRQLERHLLYEYGNFFSSTACFSVGWPLEHLIFFERSRTVQNPLGPAAYKYDWHPWPLAGNMLLGLILIAATGFTVEIWMRCPRRLQFGMRTILVLPLVVAGFLAISQERETRYWLWDAGSLTLYRSLVSYSDFADPTRWPLLFALACTPFALVWLIVKVFGRVARSNEKPRS